MFRRSVAKESGLRLTSVDYLVLSPYIDRLSLPTFPFRKRCRVPDTFDCVATDCRDWFRREIYVCIDVPSLTLARDRAKGVASNVN